ncbi:EamA family transporter RarD, partial [Pseudomonas sp. BJa5]|nr:EamA family transporter RarD [Pseudomonas sp. BGr12]
GVGHELYQHGSFAWETLLVAIGYPLYFILLRKCRTDHLGGLWANMCLLLPAASYCVIQGPMSARDLAEQPALYGLIRLLGA